jgi:hypothetical protein
MGGRHSVKAIVASIVVAGALGAPVAGGAQVAHCDDTGRRTVQARQVSNRTVRPAARRSTVQYVEVERERERSKTKTALMIAGSAAAGAGVGGALNGSKGALIGAAVGGGAASIYEAARRR